MLESETNSQVLEPDEQVSFRLVELNRVKIWQASDGRTFPLVAGGEDPPPDDNSDENGSHDDGQQESDAANPEVARLRRENAQRRREFRDLQAKLAALESEDQKRKDAEKTELERLRDQHAEAERKAAEAERKLIDSQNRQAIERAAAKAGAAYPEDVYALLDTSEFDTDDSGALKNADKLVEVFLKARPNYAAKPATQPVPGTPRSNGTVTREDQVKQAEDKLIATRHYQPFG